MQTRICAPQLQQQKPGVNGIPSKPFVLTVTHAAGDNQRLQGRHLLRHRRTSHQWSWDCFDHCSHLDCCGAIGFGVLLLLLPVVGLAAIPQIQKVARDPRQSLKASGDCASVQCLFLASAIYSHGRGRPNSFCSGLEKCAVAIG